MEHARKMVLVPEESLQIAQTPLPTVQTPGDPLTRLDNEMSSVLASDEKDDREKWKKFQQLFQRFLQTMPTRPLEQSKTSTTEESTTPMTAPSPPEPMETDEPVNVPVILTNETIIKSVPQVYRHLSGKLVTMLEKVPKEQFYWDSAGKVYINKQLVPNANIIDLVNDALRKRKAFKAVGRKHFASVLKEHSVPRLFVGNPDFWEPSTINEAITPRKNQPTIEEEANTSISGSATPLTLRQKSRSERRKIATEIQLPYDKAGQGSRLKTAWSQMQLRERSKRKTIKKTTLKN